MKAMNKHTLAIAILFAIAAIGGLWWHRLIQQDRGYYSFGYARGEMARLTEGLAPPPGSQPFQLTGRAKRFFDEGYGDALSQSPPRYPYAEVPLTMEDYIQAQTQSSPSP